MSTLPPILRKVPRVIYAAAVVQWIYTIMTNLSLMRSVDEIAGSDGDKSVLLTTIVKSYPFIGGFLDAIYLAVYGVIIRVLIAIYDNIKEAAE